MINRILCGLALSAALLLAQADPPGRVARISYVYGAASFRPGDVDDWVPVDFNRPLTTGDHLFVDVGGTAELQIGSAALRTNSTGALEFLNLDDNNVQLRLTSGSLIVRLRYLGDQDSFEVDTPNLAFSLLRTGEYRIEVKPDSATTLVTVRGGEGELTGPNQAFAVHAGEMAQVIGIDQPNYQTMGAPPRNDFDTWSLGRDQHDDQSPSARYVSRELIGYQDLDQYGSWRNTPDYGAVWVPNNTPAGWAPYHYGHWVWVDPWGWTWVDDAQWGFAPFHYGRWAYVGDTWGWVPGPIAERPVYAPALVAWVGGGAVGGGVAWFALGPREAYIPSYHTSPAYVTRVNVTNTVIVNNVVNVNVTNVQYVNRGRPGAVMAVQQTAFASARPVQSAAIVVRPEQIRSAPVMASAAIAPTRASITQTAAPGARVVQPPAAQQNRAVIAKRTPPPAPVPFAQKQQALAANGGRPLDTNQVQQIRQSQPPPARPLVRQAQVNAQTAPPPAPAPGGQFNRPTGQTPVQRTPAPVVTPTPAAPPPTPRTATPQTQTPQIARPVQTAPPVQTTRPLNDRPQSAPPPPQTTRPVQTAPPAAGPPAAPRPQATPPPPREVQQRAAPAENRPAPKEGKPAPRKDEEKKDEKKKE
jgi:hypothetical protein